MKHEFYDKAFAAGRCARPDSYEVLLIVVHSVNMISAVVHIIREPQRVLNAPEYHYQGLFFCTFEYL